MEEIKINEYVRTDKGYIEKINDFESHYTKGKRLGKSEEIIENYLRMGRNQCAFIESIDYSIPPCYPSDEELEKIKKHIVKHSPNIIDLIEVGDYVNGSYVEGFIEKNKFQNKLIITEAGMIDNKDIKSIVTKENFKNVMYEV